MVKLESITKTSPFIKHLTAEIEIPSINEALKIYNSNDERLKLIMFNTPRLLKQSGAFQFTIPTKRKEYKHLITSPNALETLNLDLDSENDQFFKDIVSGKEFIHNDEIFPYAQAYAGFQFGQFAGQLGDGRVVNLFQINSNNSNYELQLKGAGKTAFSRFADGKAVVRSSIREFIISESLNGVHIPTTRALSLTLLPGTYAQRHYAEKCAIVTRFAESFIRIGTFDYYRYKNDRVGLRKLSDFIIDQVFKNDLPKFEYGKFKEDRYKDQTEEEEVEEANEDQKEPEIIDIKDSTVYEQMYRKIAGLNAKTVSYWQVYGFLNGVLNTDNTSILGLSIDFGPFSFLDKFDPNFTPNHDDSTLRYSFNNQPSIIWWNLTRLGESLIELIGAGPELINDEEFIKNGVTEENKESIINRANSIIKLTSFEYKEIFMNNYNHLFSKRLGLKSFITGDEIIFENLLKILMMSKIDYNSFFLNLQNDKDLNNVEIFLCKKFIDRLNNPMDRIDKDENEKLTSSINDWLKLYKERLKAENISYKERFDIASKYNPKFLPRNWILEEVIDLINDDNEKNLPILKKLLTMSSNPYDESKWGSELKDYEIKWLNNDDDEKTMIQCSCSS